MNQAIPMYGHARLIPELIPMHILNKFLSIVFLLNVLLE